MSNISRRSLIKYIFNCGILSTIPTLTNKTFANNLNIDEQKKEKSAKYIFNFASPYFSSNHLTTPHAHLQIKQLIEKYTKNKVYVKIFDGGLMGVGSVLANNVQYGNVQGALLSISNLSPKIRELDLLNIPFWSSSADDYIRLFKSHIWQTYTISKLEDSNLKLLFPYVVGARTATTTKKYNKIIKSPEDFKDVIFRIPPSKNLKIFYELTKAKSVTIQWKLAADNARAGKYQALDPAIIGLYAGPNALNQELGVISEIEPVHDGWVAIGNHDFIESMDHYTKLEFLDAFNEIQTLQFKDYQNAKNFCSTEFKKLGVQIYKPTLDEKLELANKFGHTNDAWTKVKKELLGSDGVKIFDKLYQIAKG